MLNRKRSSGKATQNFSAGNTLAEYVLIGGAVVVFSIAAIMVLGRNLDYALAGLQQDMSGNMQAAAASSATSKAGALSGSSGFVFGRTSTGPAIMTPNGSLIQLSSYPANFVNSVETAGSNGTTELLAQTLKELGEQLLVDGSISQEQANIIYALANQGHRIASMEALIEDAVQNGNIQDTVTFEGKRYTVEDLSDVLGSLNDKMGGEVSKLYELRQQAVSSGLDPKLGEVVDILVSQIADMGYGVERALDDITIRNASVEQFSTYVSQYTTGGHPNWPVDTAAATLTELASASETTNLNSVEICGTGGGADSGTKCTDSKRKGN